MTKKQKARMDRLRAARGLPPQTRENLMERDHLMERVAAARCYIDRACRSEKQQQQAELSAFMSIFHPEVEDQTVRKMMREQARHD